MKNWFRISLIIAAAAAVAAVVGALWFALHREMHDVRDAFTVPTFKSYTDEFHLTIDEVKSAPGSFTEQIRVTCEKEMEVGIEVVDLKETGIREVQANNGEVYYQVGNPYKAGESGPVQADGKSSTCVISYRVSTTSSNTAWHSSISIASTNTFSHGESADGVDTTFPTPMAVSGVRTNWPDSYRRGSWIPLADLGNYKIMLTVK